MTTEQLGQESIKHGEQLKTLFKEVAKLNEKMDAIEGLTLSVEKLAMSVEQIAKNQAEDRAVWKESQDKFSERLIAVENSSDKDKASKYDKVTTQLFTIVFGAVIGYLLKSLLGI